MRSCLVEAKVEHVRLRQKHRFSYRVYYGLIDLDEVDELSRRLRLFSSQKTYAPFSLTRKDFLDHGCASIKDNLITWLRLRGFQEEIQSVTVLAHLRTFGYNFNPLSVFFVQTPTTTFGVAEVDNTFGDAKLYFLGAMDGDRLRARVPKDYYVSPFIEHDGEFLFDIRRQQESLSVQVTTLVKGQAVLTASLQGQYRPLNDAQLLAYTCKRPLVPLYVLAAIHWQALRLVLKRIPFYRKHEHSDQQKDFYVRKTFTSHIS